MLTGDFAALVTLQCVSYQLSSFWQQVKSYKGWGGDPVPEKFQMFPCKSTILCQRLFEVSGISRYGDMRISHHLG